MKSVSVETKPARFESLADLFQHFPSLQRIDDDEAAEYGGIVPALCHWQSLIMLSETARWQVVQTKHHKPLFMLACNEIEDRYQKLAEEADEVMRELFGLTEALEDTGKPTTEQVGSDDWFRCQYADDCLKFFCEDIFYTEAFDKRLRDTWLHYEEVRALFEGVMLLGLER